MGTKHIEFPLPTDKISDWSKLKAVVDSNVCVVQMIISAFDWVENRVGKGENAGLQHFLLFPQCFPKTFFRVIETLDCVVKG